MPNECSNHLTIVSDSENDIIEILKELQKEMPDATVKHISKLGIKVSFITPCVNIFAFLNKIMDKYPLIWVKNEWISEDGKAGIYVGKENNIKLAEWEDLSFEAEYFYLSK
jgi:DNA-directed RNA polymerase subunit E'/Rpb7